MKRNRPDLSDFVFHWCKSKNQDFDEAFQSLLEIIKDKKIVGRSTNVKGDWKVVCFTEAPLKAVSSLSHGHYLPFGIAIFKKLLFSKGGRPVIYQPKTDYELLADEIKWKHVSYDPNRKNFCDFTWEREWRIKADYFDLNEDDITIVVPSQEWESKLENHYKIDQVEKHYLYETLIGPGCGPLPEQLNYLIFSIENKK
ncbi:TPA: hypothetical protein ACTXXA_001565 [Legionella anisa]